MTSQEECLKGYLLAGFVRPGTEAFDIDALPTHACKHIASEGDDTRYVIYALCVVASQEEQARRRLIQYWQSVGAVVEEVHLVGESFDHKGTHWSFAQGWVRSDLVALNEEEGTGE